MNTAKVQEVHASINRLRHITSVESVVNAEFKCTGLSSDELDYFAKEFNLPAHSSGVAETRCIILPIGDHCRLYIMQGLD